MPRTPVCFTTVQTLGKVDGPPLTFGTCCLIKGMENELTLHSSLQDSVFPQTPPTLPQQRCSGREETRSFCRRRARSLAASVCCGGYCKVATFFSSGFL